MEQESVYATPAEIKKWNWGAFFLGWIWGIGNSVWISLLCFVPFVNIAMPFVLGYKGSEWAWQNKSWESVDHFKRVQKKWAIWGLVIFLISIVFLALVFILMIFAMIAAANTGSSM
ncbi:ribonuclease G [Mechercharimyces sp. CAU 1602]|uniref:ribonuclease G n=1 Tax=Mechercharimyces sp. CAU 1602 TaxID=2973933 RepID=UPI002161A879|nr:ribonuclease G [Mechercharimyces sp. CAU 1602]